ncbi:MAG: D-alanyl-D-alanine carboxypeptidase/D-alanyl-D-alanine-endopeptidase [Planctomycetota bacterium]
MKRCLALMLLAAAAIGSCTTSVGGAIAKELSVYDRHPVQVTCLVVDLDTGETLLRRDAERLCRPASTMKLLPTSAVCRREPGGEFVTRLVADRRPEGGVTLVGGGDPMLSAKDVAGLAAKLKEKGFARATGTIGVFDALSDQPRFGAGWMWDDEPASFMPSLSWVPVNGGCVEVAVDVDGTVALLPVAGGMEVSIQGREGPVRITRGRYSNRNVVVVSGSTEKRTTRKITVADPAHYAGHVLMDALRNAEMLEGSAAVESRFVPADVTAADATAAELRRSVGDVVVYTNKKSDNLGAELLLRRGLTFLPPSRGIPPDDEVLPTRFEAGVQCVAEDLAKLGFVRGKDYRIADGSGVSHYNLLSAELLVSLLVDMDAVGGESQELFRRSLPIAGVDGTLASRMKATAAEGRVFAKTGTVSAVSNLAGYIDTKSGRRLAFAIMCQSFVGSAKPWRDLQDRICASLAAQ